MVSKQINFINKMQLIQKRTLEKHHKSKKN